jgi:hypothetical protein
MGTSLFEYLRVERTRRLGRRVGWASADPSGFWADFLGGKGWWFSFGVPVYGSLEAGTYDVQYEFEGAIAFTNTVEVVECP